VKDYPIPRQQNYHGIAESTRPKVLNKAKKAEAVV